MREQLNELETTKIDAVCTRFYYNNIQRIHYRMVIHYTGDVMYRDFENYGEYQKNHDRLIRAIQDNSVIPNTFHTLREGRGVIV